MDQNQFKVIYTGRVLADHDQDTVIKAFAARFKMAPEKAQKVISAGKEVTIKAQAEHVKAYKLKSLLESLGMEVRLQRVTMKAKPPKPEPPQPTESAADQTEPQKPKPQTTASGSWSLEPIEEAKSDEQNASERTEHEQPAFNDMSRPTKVLEPKQPPTDETADEIEPDQAVTKDKSQPAWFSLVKSVGGLVIAGLGILFLLVKKFGLFKFLKVGGLMTAAAFAGYEPDELCMGNERCAETVADQIDDCWKFAGLDDHDLENMPDDEYHALKPKIENDFVACFRYEDTNERVFVSPLELRIDLIDNCSFSDHADCLALAESQFKGCYDRHQIAYLVSANTTDFYQEVADHASVFKSYYGCFQDTQGQAVFTNVLAAWDELY